MRTEVLAGQLLDVRAGTRAPDPAVDTADAMQVNRFKTAAYTVERPLQLGAALAGADRATVAALREYGVALGTAFQLRDDLLGVLGDSRITGKPAGGDLVEGKRTVLLAAVRARLAADPGRAADLAALDNGLGREDPATVARLTRLIESSGAVAEQEAEIAALVDNALGTLDRLPSTAGDAVAGLRNLAGRAAHRAS